MLVITRKEGEALRVNDSTVITVLKIRNNYVKLGFKAPLSVPIRREEIYRKIQNDKEPNRNRPGK